MRPIGERRQDFLLVCGLIIFSLTLMTLQVRHKRLALPVERLMVAVGGPIQSLVHKPVGGLRRLNLNLSSVENLREVNESLKAEVQRLRALETTYRELVLKNARLRRLLLFQQQMPFQTVTASVIARDSSNWSKTITLDVGSDSGLKEGLPVLNHQGIVGHIIRVAPKHTQVLLITDARGAVDVLIQRTRTSGVFIGSSNGRNTGYLRYVSREEDIRVDDQIISSGYGGIYPKGVPVGVVKAVDRSGTEMFQTIDVRPAVDFSRLEEVLVVVGRRPPR
ncbi:MAG: rod shape-determining protein MreC [Nitrospinota bacterium]|nr:rod shape-determining protein MreC [Nitrospinota bacterium]